MARRLLGPWARVLLVVAVVVIADQITKHAIRATIAPGEERKVIPGIALVDTHNPGVAFGLLPGDGALVTVLIVLALLALLTYFIRNSSRPLMWLPTGMLLGGALGNIIDRIRAGSVTDFIKLPLGFPPFNLADSSITVGMVILILLVERSLARGGTDREGEQRRQHEAGSRPLRRQHEPGSRPQRPQHEAGSRPLRERPEGGIRSGEDEHRPLGSEVETGH